MAVHWGTPETDPVLLALLQLMSALTTHGLDQ